MFWYRAWFTAPFLSKASHFLNPNLLSNLTDSPLSQVEHIYLPGPTDWDGGADRLTPGIFAAENRKYEISEHLFVSPDTRRLSWKRNFTRITTSRGDAGSRWLTNCVSQRDKSKFGSRTGETSFFFSSYSPHIKFVFPTLLVLFHTIRKSQPIVGTIQLIKPTLKCCKGRFKLNSYRQ